MYEIKPRLKGGGYDEENVLRHADETEALNDAANLGIQCDVFDPSGKRIALVYPDGGIDRIVG